MVDDIAIVDLFAGPGGLGEGFSAAGTEGDTRMRIRLSIEKDSFAVQTLRLRAFLRSFEGGFPQEYYDALNTGAPFPDWSETHAENWRHALDEVRQVELGKPGVFEEIAKVLDETREIHGGNTILIGGPPCQAYSLAGRSRNQGKVDYIPENDDRHFLYREYVRILDRLRPAAFVMENVKGMLSSKVGGGAIFERVLEDLGSAGDGYHLLPLADPLEGPAGKRSARSYIVRAEHHGVPQARHRVFIVGLRRDRCEAFDMSSLALAQGVPDAGASVMATLSGLPPLRSGLSRGDSPEAWAEAVHDAADRLLGSTATPADIRDELVALRNDGLAACRKRSDALQKPFGNQINPDLASWLADPKLKRVLQHETRGHILGDLGRYLFAAVCARVRGKSPKLADFPDFLQPAHKNRDTGAFADRFRVQLAEDPSTTITSHISKDGHYYIHPDPKQCRSLTVREAARLQTFPDNYYFSGPRTEQYKQVGNAVPPFLARRIARALRDQILQGGTTSRR